MAINPTTLKALIDTQITNETVNFAITPLEVGGRMKDTVDYTTEQIANISLLQGSLYILVTANGTDVENAIELQTAYNTAKTMSPSVTNRITVIAAPGNYNFNGSLLNMDTQYIDLVSLDGNRSIIFNGDYVSFSINSINVTANDVFVKGVDVSKDSKPFIIGNSLSLLKVENCKGGSGSFNATDFFSTISGTFINCEGGNQSFGKQLTTLSGTFINCKSGIFSFFSTASGIFTDCISGESSFGASTVTPGTSSGTFTNCQGGIRSFGGGPSGKCQGVYNNCIGGEDSFGNFGGVLTGKLYYCRLNLGTFQAVSGAGQTRYCLDGTNTANNQG